MNALSQRHAELRHPEQAHALHLDAEPLQPRLPRRRARDVPHPQSAFPSPLITSSSALTSHQQYGVGAIPWSPLARGRLTRPLTQQTKRGEVDRFIGQYSKSQASADAIVNRVEELAGKKGCSMAQLALAWIMARPGVTAPIVGTTSLDNLRDLAGECEREACCGENCRLTPLRRCGGR